MDDRVLWELVVQVKRSTQVSKQYINVAMQTYTYRQLIRVSSYFIKNGLKIHYKFVN